MVRDWDAESYHRVSTPHVAWSDAVIERLDLRGDETVLDAGCGSGRVTARLLEHLPRGRVIAIDGSPEMCAKAREILCPPTPDADVREADLATLRLGDGERVDAVFSNAVFHWVPDHPALFASLVAALRPGGRLSAQCGGEDNVARVHEAAAEALQRLGLAQHLADRPAPWNFAPAWLTEQRLHEAGFSVAKAWVQPWPVVPDDPRRFLQTVCLGPYLEALPDEAHDGFLDVVLEHLGTPTELDYVRLNLTHRHPRARLTRLRALRVPGAGSLCAVMPEVRPMTAEELLQYRNEPYRQELIAGILHEMEPTGAEHGIVAARVIAQLLEHVDRHDLGVVFATEVGFHLASDPDTVRSPDAAFVAKERADAVGSPATFWPGPPDLAVEVVSPSDRDSSVEAKVLDWLAAGTSCVVVLDPPRRMATVHRSRDDVRVLTGREALDLGDLLPGFRPLVGGLFA